MATPSAMQESVLPKTVKMEKQEGGWSFQYTHEWNDYSGELIVVQDTGLFVWQILENKPKLLDATFAAGDYTLTQVRDDIMMHIEFRVLDESIDVKLKRCSQTQDVGMGQMAARITKLEERVEELEAQIKTPKIPGSKYTYSPTVTDEQLMRYANVFSESYKTYRKTQVNTTESTVFMMWKKGDDSWQLVTEYLARVRNMSMVIPHWHSNYPKGITGIVSFHKYTENMCVKGMYVPGCWQVTRIEWGNSDRMIMGPFEYINGPYQYWISVSPLECISDALKKELDLD